MPTKVVGAKRATPAKAQAAKTTKAKAKPKPKASDDGVSGRYSIKCPEFCEMQYGSKDAVPCEINLCLSSTRKNLWGEWDLEAYSGFLRCIEPYQPGKKLHFEMRGTENGEGESFCEIDRADSWLQIDEAKKTIEGCLGEFRWGGGPYTFTGKRVAGPPPGIVYCKSGFRSNNEENEITFRQYPCWHYWSDINASEAAYESDTTQESEVEDIRREAKEAQDKREAKRLARKASKGSIARNTRKRKRRGGEEPESYNEDDAYDDEEENTSWLIVRPNAMIEEETPLTIGNLTYDEQGLKAFGHKLIEPEEVMKLVETKGSPRGLLERLRAQLALYGLPDCKTVKAAKETILKDYKENDNALEVSFEQTMRSTDIETRYEALQLLIANVSMAKWNKEKYGEGTGKHMPSTASILVRLGRERAKEAVKRRLQERSMRE